MVNQAGKALNNIVGSINEVADIMNGIAGGAREQAAGIEEINASVSTMERMTQQNASLVEQNAAAARNLADQSRQLAEMMSFFVIDDASMTEAQKIPEPLIKKIETIQKPTSLPPTPIETASERSKAEAPTARF